MDRSIEPTTDIAPRQSQGDIDPRSSGGVDHSGLTYDPPKRVFVEPVEDFLMDRPEDRRNPFFRR